MCVGSAIVFLRAAQGIRAKRDKVAGLREGDARAAGLVVAKKQRVEYGTGVKQHDRKGRGKDDNGPGKG